MTPHQLHSVYFTSQDAGLLPHFLPSATGERGRKDRKEREQEELIFASPPVTIFGVSGWLIRGCHTGKEERDKVPGSCLHLRRPVTPFCTRRAFRLKGEARALGLSAPPLSRSCNHLPCTHSEGPPHTVSAGPRGIMDAVCARGPTCHVHPLLICMSSIVTSDFTHKTQDKDKIMKTFKMAAAEREIKRTGPCVAARVPCAPHPRGAFQPLAPSLIWACFAEIFQN